MKRAAVAGGVFLAVILFLYWRASIPVSAPTTADTAANRQVATAPGAVLRRAPASPLSAPEEPRKTPALEQPFTAADGSLEVVVTGNGAPVAAGEVRIYITRGRDPNTGRPEWRHVATIATAADGRARQYAGPGSYLIAVRKSGFATAFHSVDRPRGEDITRAEVLLQAGTPLAIRTLQKSDKRPVPLADVRVEPQHWGPVEERYVLRTDERGEGRLPAVAPGRYSIEGSADAYATARSEAHVPRSEPVELMFHAASYLEGQVVKADGSPAANATVLAMSEVDQTALTNATGAFSLSVAPGRFAVTATLDSETGSVPGTVSVAPGGTKSGLVIRLSPANRILGTVTDKASGAAIAGAVVSVSPHQLAGDSGRGISDADGHYAVQPLPPGSYDVAVNAPGYGEATTNGISLDAGQKFVFDAALEKTGSVEGFVRDGSGQAVVGAIVHEPAFDREELSARTDAAGHYLLTGLPPGKTSLDARRDGAGLGQAQAVLVRPGDTTKLDFTLGEDGTLSGRVTQKDGTPVTGEVWIFGQTGLFQRHTLTTDEKGAFSVMLAAGTYRLGVNRSHFRPASVTAGKATHLDIVLDDDEGQRIRGHVLDVDGTPAPFSAVQYGPAKHDDKKPLGLRGTDENGAFSFDRLPQAGLVMRAIYGGKTSDDVLIDANTREVELRLRPGGMLHGRVVGEPAPQSITVDVTSSEYPSIWESGPHFPGHEFTMRDAVPGPVTVSVKANDGRTGQTQTTIPLGGSVDVTIQLSPSARVVGRVLDQVGQPVPGAWVAVREGSVWSEGDGDQTDADGTFDIRPVPAGVQTLRVNSIRGRVTKKISVAQGQTLQLGDVLLERRHIDPGSVGAMLVQRSGQVLANWVEPGGPAAIAGVMIGDVIASIDGTTVRSLDDANARLVGAPGSRVQVAIKRGESTQTVTIARAE